MGLWTRLRSGSEAARIPPYITSSQVFERTSSTSNLSDSLDSEILTCLYLEDRPASLTRSASLKAATPPDYKLLAPVAPRYPILPRDEEGKETLPRYSSSIKKEGSLVRKMESVNPFRPATNRGWSSVHLVLNNTQLDVYNISSRKSNANGIDYKIGNLIKSYTLQYAEVGLAIDYTKRLHVIRVRAESEQFLLLSSNETECVNWAHAIQMGIDLALPLDERKLPRTRSIPYRSRGRRSHSTSDTPNPRSPRPSNVESTSTSSFSSESRVSLDMRLRRTPTSISAVSARTGTSARGSISGMSGLSPTSTISSDNSSQTQTSRPLIYSTGSANSSRPVSFHRDNVHPTSRNHLGLHHSHLPNILSVFSQHQDSNESEDNPSPVKPTSLSTPSSRANLRRITFSLPHHPHKNSRLDTNDETNITSTSTAANNSPPSTGSDDSYDDEDTALNQSDQQTQSEALRPPSSLYYKWNPRRNRRRNHSSYAERCLPSLIADTPWLNKTVVVKGRKYIVRETSLQPVNSTPHLIFT